MEIFWDIKNVGKYEVLYQSGIKENENFHRTYELIKNLSYNTQYLEFIDKSLKQEIHSVLRVELTKTFIIIGISIVESVLYYFLKSHNLQRKDNYEEITTMTSNQKKVNGVFIKVETKIFRKLKKEKEVEMNLDSMLKRTEQKKILGNDHSIYSELKHLRKIRNKIHLYLIEENLDHDLNNFGDSEITLMKKSLRKIMYSDIFTMEKSEKTILLDFLE